MEKVFSVLEKQGAQAVHKLAQLVPTNFGLSRQLPVYRQELWEPSSYPYLELIVAFSCICFAFEFYLDVRQHRRLQLRTPPGELTRVVGEIDERQSQAKGDGNKGEEKPLTMLQKISDKFSASRSYQLDKSSFGFVESIAHQIESVLLLVLGFIPFLWDISSKVAARMGLGQNEIVVSLVFLGLNMVYEQIVNLPFSLYSTFVIEQRHGFNKQTLGLYFLDKLKMMVLLAVIGGPLVSAIIAVIKWGGPRFYLYLWLLMFTFSILMMSVYPVFIAPLFNKFEPLDNADLKAKIEKLASKVKFPLTKIFVIDGSKRSAHSNAYFYGLGKNKRIVLFDTLLTQMQDSELEAVLGHELGHWYKMHTIQMFAFTQVYMFSAFFVFGSVMGSKPLYASFGFATRPTLIGLFLFFTTIWAPIDKVLSFLQTVGVRHNEFQADAFAVDLGYGPELQTGLVKLQLENLGAMNTDPLYSCYHYSHPPLVERLTAISKELKKRE